MASIVGAEELGHGPEGEGWFALRIRGDIREPDNRGATTTTVSKLLTGLHSSTHNAGEDSFPGDNHPSRQLPVARIGCLLCDMTWRAARSIVQDIHGR